MAKRESDEVSEKRHEESNGKAAFFVRGVHPISANS